MSDTEPTTADERLIAVIQDHARILYQAEAAAIVAALRSSPAALADLNGGEWVPFTGYEVVVHHAPGYADDGVASIGSTPHTPIPPERGINGHVGTWTTVHPVAYFVPWEATND